MGLNPRGQGGCRCATSNISSTQREIRFLMKKSGQWNYELKTRSNEVRTLMQRPGSRVARVVRGVHMATIRTQGNATLRCITVTQGDPCQGWKNTPRSPGQDLPIRAAEIGVLSPGDDHHTPFPIPSKSSGTAPQSPQTRSNVRSLFVLASVHNSPHLQDVRGFIKDAIKFPARLGARAIWSLLGRIGA